MSTCENRFSHTDLLRGPHTKIKVLLQADLLSDPSEKDKSILKAATQPKFDKSILKTTTQPKFSKTLYLSPLPPLPPPSRLSFLSPARLEAATRRWWLRCTPTHWSEEGGRRWRLPSLLPSQIWLEGGGRGRPLAGGAGRTVTGHGRAAAAAACSGGGRRSAAVLPPPRSGRRRPFHSPPLPSQIRLHRREDGDGDCMQRRRPEVGGGAPLPSRVWLRCGEAGTDNGGLM